MARLPVSRPSKKQLAERKQAKKETNWLKSLEALWHQLEKLCWEGSFDEFLCRCENCGQEQLGQNPACVVCGCQIAVFVSPL